VSGDRVGNILAENANNNVQLLNVADMAAVGENIDYQANNNDTHGVVDATEEVGGVRELVSGDRVSNILAENANNNAQLLDVHESESEQQFAAREEEGVGEEINAEQRAGDPVGDVILDILGANENIGNVENNEEFQDDRRDVVDFPGHEQEHDEYEWSSDIAQINHRLELLIQQQHLKDDKINKLERRIKELEHWKITVLSTSWPSCTSVGGDNFLAAADSVSEEILVAGENEDNMSFNVGDDNRRRQRTRRRGRNPPLLESTAQPPTKRNRAIAPNNDQGQSPYYRDDFLNNARRTNAPDPVIADAHAGLINCDVICYSNAIFQGIASCIHVSDFLQTPPNDEHRRFPLYYEFASVMSSMVSGQESVVNPTSFIDLFRPKNSDTNYAEGMYFDSSQWMNQLTTYVPLTDYSFC
jgi:hypothetical protein